MFKLLTPALMAVQIVAVTLAVCSSAWAASITATTAPTSFVVKVALIPAPVQQPPVVVPVVPPIVVPGLPVSAFCTKNNLPAAHGAVVTVVCSTGAVVDIEPGTVPGHTFAPMHGGAYRYITQVSPNGALFETEDAFSGAGTTTAWRIVHLGGRNYLEMTLGW